MDTWKMVNICSKRTGCTFLSFLLAFTRPRYSRPFSQHVSDTPSCSQEYGELLVMTGRGRLVSYGSLGYVTAFVFIYPWLLEIHASFQAINITPPPLLHIHQLADRLYSAFFVLSLRLAPEHQSSPNQSHNLASLNPTVILQVLFAARSNAVTARRRLDFPLIRFMGMVGYREYQTEMKICEHFHRFSNIG